MLRLWMLAALLGSTVTAGAQMAPPTLGGAWQVTDVAGAALPEGAPLTLDFAADGRVSGQAGCNRFMGGYVQDGLAFGFSAVAGTRMACEPDRMEAEARMFEAMSAVTWFTLTPGGALELLGPNGLLIRATRP